MVTQRNGAVPPVRYHKSFRLYTCRSVGTEPSISETAKTAFAHPCYTVREHDPVLAMTEDSLQVERRSASSPPPLSLSSGFLTMDHTA